MTVQHPPSLYEWAGGVEAFERLTKAFYERVRADDLVGPLFANMPDDHPHHVPRWFAEVFGGPKVYNGGQGGHAHMISRHLGRGLTEAQRRCWVNLLLDCADETGLPADPEFRSAFVAYIEWGTRLALDNSQPGTDPPREAPVPRWGWGEAPPYEG